MPSPAEIRGTLIQGAFAAALRTPDGAPPAGLVGRRDEIPTRRFAVYRNNVHASLIDVLAGRYPVVERLVGPAFFRTLARAFVDTGLPRSPVLLEYGGGFAAFIDGFEPAASLAYLGDIARLEWAWHASYHAADTEPLDAHALAAIAPERLPDLKLAPHPSLRLIRSPWPVLAIWHANTHDDRVRPIDVHAGGDDVLVLRPHWEVTLRRLPPGGAAFLAALAGGTPLGTAAQRAAHADAAFDLAGNLRDLLAAGGVAGLRHGARNPCDASRPGP